MDCLVRVAQQHGFKIIRKNKWSLYLILLEAVLAMIWCHILILMTLLGGMHLDADQDKGITKLWPLAPLFPFAYWWLSAFTVVWTTIPTLPPSLTE